MAEGDDPPPRQYKLKPKEFERLNAPPGASAKSVDHDVFAIRRQVRERELAAGFDDIKPLPPKKSRRTRDFWIILALGWGVLITIGSNAAGRPGAEVGAGLGIAFSAGLWWIMYHILNKY